MSTIAQTFFPNTVAHDTVYGTDIRKLAESLPTLDDTSICGFGTSGNKNIVVDPFTTNTTDVTPMTAAALDPLGWAINETGADGMGATSTAKRTIAAGTWSFQGTLKASPAAALNAVTVKVRVYRVAASGGARTQLGSEGSANAGLITTAGTSWSTTITDIGAVTIEADETIQVSYYINATGQVGGLSVIFEVGDAIVTNDLQVQVPSPGIRTKYISSLTGSLSFVGSIAKRAGKTLSAALSFVGPTTRPLAVVSHGMTAALSFVGAVNKFTSRSLDAAALSFAGNLAKQTGKALSGAISFVGTLTNNSKTISGVTRNRTGTALGSCTVHLFRTSNDVEVAETTSNATTGAYSFVIASTGTHYVVAYKAGSPDVFGTTKNTLTGV